MVKKIINFDDRARKGLQKGINQLSNAVVTTLGPNGRNVVINTNGQIQSTKDGVTVAKAIEVEDEIENTGVNLLKQAAIKTADQAGDGTTTSTLLASEIYNKGLAYSDKGHNAVEIKRGIDTAVKEVVDNLTQISQEISSEDQLRQVATISANNDESVGELIATAMKNVGADGVVTIEESRTGETYLETVEGMQFDRGFKSPYFVNDNDNMSCVLQKPMILLHKGKITQVKDLLPLLEGMSQQSKSLLIVAEDIDGEALATLIVNKMRGILNVCAVKAPDFGDRRTLILEDIATLTGGTVVDRDKGMKLEKLDPEWLGQARTVTVTKETTTIVDGAGSEEAISERVQNLQSQIEGASSSYEVEKLQERLAKMVGGVAVIHVGGNTETEMRETKDRVDDALNATKAAIEEGIVAGGGVALLNISKMLTTTMATKDYQLGYNIVKEAIKTPFRQILKNAGVDDSGIYQIESKCMSKKDTNVGFDLKTCKYINFLESGIIDPAKVTRCAIENASSVAGTALLTECVVVEKEKETQDAPSMDMGGMF
jgi:chaperonin GroEL